MRQYGPLDYVPARITAYEDRYEGLCDPEYGFMRLVNADEHNNPKALSCDLPANHEGDHWDKSWTLSWRFEPETA